MKLKTDGIEIHNSIFTLKEVEIINSEIDKLELENTFGNREFLMNREAILKLILNEKFLNLIKKNVKDGQIIKSIYFDKPPSSNWIVNWHQDLTLNLKNKIEVKEFSNWRKKKDCYVVKPGIAILDNTFTFRIHLDKCSKNNGALRVIKGSHKLGEIDVRNLTSENVGEIETCEVEKGGVLVMKPLILHSSKRVENNLRRRVIHLEISNSKLPNGLKWKENIKLELKTSG